MIWSPHFTYALRFEGRYGLWELTINRFRTRFYRSREAAMKTVLRYRRMLENEAASFQN